LVVELARTVIKMFLMFLVTLNKYDENVMQETCASFLYTFLEHVSGALGLASLGDPKRPLGNLKVVA